VQVSATPPLTTTVCYLCAHTKRVTQFIKIHKHPIYHLWYMESMVPVVYWGSIMNGYLQTIPQCMSPPLQFINDNAWRCCMFGLGNVSPSFMCTQVPHNQHALQFHPLVQVQTYTFYLMHKTRTKTTVSLNPPKCMFRCSHAVQFRDFRHIAPFSGCIWITITITISSQNEMRVTKNIYIWGDEIRK